MFGINRLKKDVFRLERENYKYYKDSLDLQSRVEQLARARDAATSMSVRLVAENERLKKAIDILKRTADQKDRTEAAEILKPKETTDPNVNYSATGELYYRIKPSSALALGFLSFLLGLSIPRD